MRVLALDTTTREGSVALVVDDRVVEERRGDSLRTHAERLPAEILAVIDQHGLTTADVDLFAVASGPGSFTGLRIGIATIQGLAFTTGRPVVAVSALEVLAQIASATCPPGALAAAWMDAHRREVFAALYRVTASPLYDSDRLSLMQGPTVDDPADILDRWAKYLDGASVTFIGDGVLLYAETIHRLQASTEQAWSAPLLAGAVGRMAVARARRGETITPAAIQPLYVRRPDAELARDSSPLGRTRGTQG